MYVWQKLRQQPLVWVSVSILSAVAIEIISKQNYISDSPPRLEFPFAIRTLMFLLWSFWLVIAVRNHASKTSRFNSSKFNNYQLAAIGFTVVIGLIFLSLFLVSPQQFSLLALEDRIVENISALSCLIAAFVMAISASKVYGWRSSRFRLVYSIALVFLSLIIFVIGMEEISWFQRVLDIETPQGFPTNYQGEMNLHNFATGIFEYIYYFGAFVAFGIVPLSKNFFQKYRWYSSINILLPGSLSFHVGAIAAAYNYDMWNFSPTQIAFGITFFGMFFYAFDTTDFKTKIFQTVLLVLMLVSQTAFIFKGDELLRLWDVTEYKEFFIALTMLVYAFEILGKVRSFDSKRTLKRVRGEATL